MNSMQTRLNLKNEAKKRMKELNFGDPVTNVCAGDKGRHAYFVGHKRFSYLHAQCTDRKGKFWDTEIGVIYPGHLSSEECERIYAPIHKAHFDR